MAEAELSTELSQREARNKLARYYPDEGPLRRELYPRHLEFFRAGAQHRERLILAANRVGKTEGVGGYETTLHLTGRYPRWWEGRRFDRPIRAWAAGDTGKTVRDIIQFKMLGPEGAHGTGLIPGDALLRTTAKPGVSDAVELIEVAHAGGGASMLALKSYDQGREAFQGAEIDLGWLDEEPPQAIYSECLTRTMATKPGAIGGLLMLTFTPLQGMTPLIMDFLEGKRA